MNLGRALRQIDEIHAQLASSQVYRGYRALPVACTGAFALLGGAAYPWIVPGNSPYLFVAFWVSIAAASIAIVGTEIAKNALRSTRAQRRITWCVVGQFVPCLVAGAVISAAVCGTSAGHVAWLPGLWAILYSLGIFASRPYLPRATGWVALFYLLAGGWLLWYGRGQMRPDSFGMAITFGPGQFLAGLVLYWNLERKKDV